MQEPIVHELLLDVLHSLVNLGSATFLPDLDSVCGEVDLLLASSLAIKVPLLREALLANVGILAAVQAAHCHLLLKNSESPFWPVVGREERIVGLPDADVVDDLLRLGRHLVRGVLDHVSEAQNDRNDVHRNAHRHVGLILRRPITAQFVLL